MATLVEQQPRLGQESWIWQPTLTGDQGQLTLRVGEQKFFAERVGDSCYISWPTTESYHDVVRRMLKAIGKVKKVAIDLTSSDEDVSQRVTKADALSLIESNSSASELPNSLHLSTRNGTESLGLVEEDGTWILSVCGPAREDTSPLRRLLADTACYPFVDIAVAAVPTVDSVIGQLIAA